MSKKLEVPEFIQKISTLKKIPVEALMAELAKTKEDLNKSGLTGDLNNYAKYAMMSKYRDIKKSPKIKEKYATGNFVGFKVGDQGPLDQAEKMREWAKYTVDSKGLETAVSQGLVRVGPGGSIEVLDSRPKVFGRSNPKFGTPLPQTLHVRSRNIFMLAKQAKDEKYRYTRLQTNDNRLSIAWAQLPKDKMVSFTAKIQRDDPAAGYLLSSVNGKEDFTKFKEVKAENIEYFKEFLKAFAKDVTPLSEVVKLHEAIAKNWERFVVVKGVVAYIGWEAETYKGMPCVLIDPELGFEAEQQVRFFVRDHLKVNFGQYSEIYLLGQTKQKNAKDDNGKEYVAEVFIDAWGFYPVPGKMTAPKTNLLEDTGEEQVEGFIPLKS